MINCTKVDHESVICDGVLFKVPEEKISTDDTLFWIYLGTYVFLMLFAGLMSGLTLGLLSLDSNQLEVLQVAGREKDKKYAKRIVPLVKRHHLLLVTLLLANACSVEAMPIFMDKITNPIVAILVSVTAVLIFGEIIPQALCSRYGLAIGYYLSPLVYFLMAAFFIVSWPISKLLDCLLGKNHGTFFRRAELKALVDLHQNSVLDDEDPLTIDEALIIQGALDLKNKVARDALIPFNNVVLLYDDDVLDEKTMDMILNAGHSRVPVYDKSNKKVIGILLVKTIIKLNPADAVPVHTQMNRDAFLTFTEHEPLYNILNAFQTGRSHICIIKKDDMSFEESLNEKILGILTLEDVIEEILQEEIIDETDKYIDVARRIQVARLKKKLSRVPGAKLLAIEGPKAGSSKVSLKENNPEDEKTPLLGPPDV